MTCIRVIIDNMSKDNHIKINHLVVLGRPNSGKSTLINTLLNQKVAITSPRPQTTRINRTFLYQSDLGQFTISDTPGIMGKVRDTLGKAVNKQPKKQLDIADLIVYLVDISRPKGDEENKALALARLTTCPKLLVYNKIDKAVGAKNYLAQFNFLEEEFDDCISISALKTTHTKALLTKIFQLLPPSAQKVTPASTSNSPLLDINSEDYLADLIREKAFLKLRKEVPYTVNVRIDSIESIDNLIKIYATIETTADKYKKMIIGKGGSMIKNIGTMARKELELISQKKVFLGLNVVTHKHWQEAYI